MWSLLISTVTVDAPLYDTRLRADNGCNPAGCSGDLTTDGDRETPDSRWSCSPSLGSAGSTCSIIYGLSDPQFIQAINIALYRGDERTRTIDIYVDGVIVTTWTSSGTTSDFETVTLGVTGSTIELRGVLGNSEFLSILEVEILIIPDGATLPPAPAPTSTGTLEPVGLIPLASSHGNSRDRFLAKDNDMSTSWTCNGSTTRSGECDIQFSLFWFRHIKQVKIALSNGEDAAIDMTIGNTRFADNPHEVAVTSSGTTTAFETYEFDVFTDRIAISTSFGSSDESISIAEVEFVEELQAGEIPVESFRPPFDSEGGTTDDVAPDGFEWWSGSDEALGEELHFRLGIWAELTAVLLQFPTGDTYLFDLHLFTEADGGREPFTTITGLESEDTAGWQTFDLQLDADQTVTEVSLVIRGTGSGASGFHLQNAGFMGTRVDNPTDTFYVGTTHIEFWGSPLYPDFVGEGTSDQEAIMGAICAVKKASFDGIDCVGEDPAATGTVSLPLGDYFVDGNIFMKSGVTLDGDNAEDRPSETYIFLEDGAAGNTAIDAIIVVDGVTDAVIDEVWVGGLYDPETSNAISAVAGLGTTAISITNSQNIVYSFGWVENVDGDAIVIRDSQMVSIDAGRFDEEILPNRIASSRGIGLLVDTCENVSVRRHAIYDNGVAGIHIVDTTDFTFEATFDRFLEEGDGYVGSVDGQQPIEVIVESSHRVTFQNMDVRSANDPVMTVSADSSEVIFNDNGFGRVASGTCVIQAEDPSVVTAEDDELMLVGSCYVKV
ncbi:unnamed protein product [Ascophyllum nodosum]